MPANDPEHLRGYSIDRNDQLSSVVLLGLAVSGALAAVVLDLILIG